MKHNDLCALLGSLGFRAPPATLDAFLGHAMQSRLSAVKTLEDLCALERREREAKNLALRVKMATLGSVLPLDRFDWAHPRSIDRPLYESLLGLDFVKHGHNVLLRGPAGVGKTTLAQNLGLESLKHGFTVRFSTLASILADLLRDESLPALERRLQRYTKPHLLICDEIGYLPCDNRAADILYNIVTRRHLARSIVITTNLSFKQWGSLFPGAACISALVDRFVQHCYVLDIDADSYRQKLSRDFPLPPAASPSKAKPQKPPAP